MSKHFNTKIGKLGEEIGVTYLNKMGYKIIETNYRCPIGEIDVITKYKGFIVFVEIKSRLQNAFGLPEEAVDWAKQRKIVKVAQWFLKQKGLSDARCRFDVLAVSIVQGKEAEFRLIENAFEVE